MTKSKVNTEFTPTTQAASQPLRKLLDEGSGDAATDVRLRELVDVWARLRRVLAVIAASSGLEALDEAAATVILQDDATPAELTRPVLLFTHLDAMAAGQAAEHVVFAPPATSIAPPRAKRTSKRFPVTSAKPTPAKKQKKSISLPFDVPVDTPAEIIADLRHFAEHAAAQNKTPAQLAYPWRGKRTWYQPADDVSLHLLHWRFMMRHRATFFQLALYAPTSNAPYRRSLKAKALRARMTFLSANIEEFGWFGFMDRFENTVHNTLLWLGGRPAKHSTGAKDKPTDGGLVDLFREDPGRYKAKIKRMMDPHRIDADGYASIPTLLEETNALDPTRESHKRLSDRALARIVVDINDHPKYRGEWVGNKTTGPWKELIAYEPLLGEQEKVRALSKANKRVATYDVKPFKSAEQAAQDSDFKVLGIYTVTGPTVPFTAGGPHFVPKKSKARPVLPGLESGDEREEVYEHESDEKKDSASEHESTVSEPENDDSEHDSDAKGSDDDEEKPLPPSTADADEKEDEADDEPSDK